MGKLDKYYKVNHKNGNYVVCELSYKSKKAPVILDSNVFEKIKKLDRNWTINEKGFVITIFKMTHEGKNISKEITMHDVVMKILDPDYDDRNVKTILHINKLGVDNRKENLMYDTNDKDITKNIKKKERTINFPKETGIIPDEIPSYVWYLKEDSTHGDRFMLDVGDINWKSTASKKVSLRYKLEETKKYMRYLKDTRPDLFEDYSMNGDLNNDGKELIKSFIKISQKAGFKINSNNKDNTEDYLREKIDELTKEERVFLEMFNPEMGRINFKDC